METLDGRRLAAAQRQARKRRQRQQRLMSIVALALLSVSGFVALIFLWEDDGRRCAKEELIGDTEMCTRWETREGLHSQIVE